jgi:phage shock protein PspC (stress-responsive transcriptional regulator)
MSVKLRNATPYVATPILWREAMSGKRLTRSRQHNIIAGVMGGIADYLGWSPFKVRLLFVIVSCASVAVPGILIYLILWFLMPMADE